MKNKKVRRMLAVMMAMSLSVSMCAGTALATEPAADTAVEKEAAEEEPTKKADADTSENVDDAEETSSEESAAVKAEEETSSEESAPVKEEEKSDAEETSETDDNSIALQADDGQQGADQPGSGEAAPGGDGQTPPEGGEGGPGGPGGPGGQPSVEIDPSVVTDKYGMKGYHALLGSWGSGGDNINDVENGDNDYLYTMNLAQFKDFLIHVCSKTQRENIRNIYPYGFSLNKSDYNKIKNYGEFEADNVINVSKIDNTYLYLYFGLFIISFTSYFIYSLFSYKHNKEKYLRFAGVLLNNGINKRQIFNLNMFASLLLFIPSIVLSIISYVGIIIPIYNSQVIDLTFYDMTLINNLDFDYYSINNIPSNLIHFQNMFLLILIIIVPFVFIQISYNKKITKKN